MYVLPNYIYTSLQVPSFVALSHREIQVDQTISVLSDFSSHNKFH
jgi:hypothetical protein